MDIVNHGPSKGAPRTTNCQLFGRRNLAALGIVEVATKSTSHCGLASVRRPYPYSILASRPHSPNVSRRTSPEHRRPDLRAVRDHILDGLVAPALRSLREGTVILGVIVSRVGSMCGGVAVTVAVSRRKASAQEWADCPRLSVRCLGRMFHVCCTASVVVRCMHRTALAGRRQLRGAWSW
jgi:hypothetical protein